MSQNIVDAKGLLCPKPLIMTKKALKSGTGAFKVILDNKTAFENVSRFLTDNNVSYNIEENGEIFTLHVSADGKELKHSNAEDYCPAPSPDAAKQNSTAPVFCFRNDRMGEGPEELGKILIQGCCNTLVELDPLPSALVFYNSGVHLTLKNSPVVESLKELEKKGVRILVCGTCADYFNVKDDVTAGTISNMYDILECLSSARVVTP